VPAAIFLGFGTAALMARTPSSQSSKGENLGALAEGMLFLILLIIAGVLLLLVIIRAFLRYGVQHLRSSVKAALLTTEEGEGSAAEFHPKETLPDDGTYTTKTRANILREILNVSSFAFSVSHKDESANLTEIPDENILGEMIYNGIPPRESRCLSAARSWRRNSAQPAAPAQ
jgi:hypothetical protein